MNKNTTLIVSDILFYPHTILISQKYLLLDLKQELPIF
jgi:hypothetical protein